MPLNYAEINSRTMNLLLSVKKRMPSIEPISSGVDNVAAAITQITTDASDLAAQEREAQRKVEFMW